jgi:membrane peptidoglycan carboxypeptidase
MANAYATIANRGQRADVHVISKVVDTKTGNTWTWKQPQRDGIRRAVSDDTSYAMQQVVKSGTGQAALALGRPAAGKTGTATNAANEVSSSWFVGYTPQMATAVMYVRGDGNDGLNGYLEPFYGGAYPTRTWTAVMERIHRGVPVKQFPPPANLEQRVDDEEHAPYTPPPTPEYTPEPEPTPTEEPEPTPTPTPTPTPSPTPTPTPTPTPSDPCDGLICDPSDEGEGEPSPPPEERDGGDRAAARDLSDE